MAEITSIPKETPTKEDLAECATTTSSQNPVSLVILTFYHLILD